MAKPPILGGVDGTVTINPGDFSDVVGVTGDAGRFGIIGSNSANSAFGFLAGADLVFTEHVGVYGQSDKQGVMGISTSIGGTGVFGGHTEPFGFGVRGESAGGRAVQGQNSLNAALGFLAGTDPIFNQDAGVYGQSNRQGVMGLSTSASGTGVYGGSTIPGGGSGIGVRGETSSGVGVEGKSFGSGVAVKGLSLDSSGNIDPNGTAGVFIGNVTITENLNAKDVFCMGGDCAEDFDIAGLEPIDPGTVMVVNDAGSLQPCQNAYDRKVTGVLSGAGEYKPGITLDKRHSALNRLPVALIGKVYCKVDAAYGPVEIGDLLTTSATPGHAMKVGDPLRAFGAVIGKALQSLPDGRSLIPILVALQ